MIKLESRSQVYSFELNQALNTKGFKSIFKDCIDDYEWCKFSISKNADDGVERIYFLITEENNSALDSDGDFN